MKARVISAILAVLLLVVVYWSIGDKGILGLIMIGSVAIVREYARVVFRRFNPPKHLEVVFGLLSSLVFLATLLDYFWGFAAIIIATVAFLAMSLIEIRTADDVAPTLQLQSLGILGFLYCGVFTGLTARLLQLDRGAVWLFGLMAIVFTGDTFAYLFGRAFGKRKLLEAVSPKKTIEGSLGGLLGSALAGAILGLFFLTDRSMIALILMALTTGAFAQVGDLFESLLKRVADVKDSGTIMPGHGGLLDRVDGLLFAAPIYYVLARFLLL